MDPSRINNPYVNFVPGSKTELPSERKLHTCAGAARKKAMEAPSQEKSDFADANSFVKGHIHQKKSSRSMIGLRREAEEQGISPSSRNHPEAIDLRSFMRPRSSSLSNSWIQFARTKENRDSDVSSHSKRLDEMLVSCMQISRESVSKNLSESLSRINENMISDDDLLNSLDSHEGVRTKVNDVFDELRLNLAIKTSKVLPEKITAKLMPEKYIDNDSKMKAAWDSADRSS